jgi:predicted amidophosphoribosyltransferase
MVDRRTCLVCGTQFPTTREFCPVCILRGALDEGTESGESSEKMAAQAAALPFEHYELEKSDDGMPAAQWASHTKHST